MMQTVNLSSTHTHEASSIFPDQSGNRACVRYAYTTVASTLDATDRALKIAHSILGKLTNMLPEARTLTQTILQGHIDELQSDTHIVGQASSKVSSYIPLIGRFVSLGIQGTEAIAQINLRLIQKQTNCTTAILQWIAHTTGKTAQKIVHMCRKSIHQPKRFLQTALEQTEISLPIDFPPQKIALSFHVDPISLQKRIGPYNISQGSFYQVGRLLNGITTFACKEGVALCTAPLDVLSSDHLSWTWDIGWSMASFFLGQDFGTSFILEYVNRIASLQEVDLFLGKRVEEIISLPFYTISFVEKWLKILSEIQQIPNQEESCKKVLLSAYQEVQNAKNELDQCCTLQPTYEEKKQLLTSLLTSLAALFSSEKLSLSSMKQKQAILQSTIQTIKGQPTFSKSKNFLKLLEQSDKDTQALMSMKKTERTAPRIITTIASAAPRLDKLLGPILPFPLFSEAAKGTVLTACTAIPLSKYAFEFSLHKYMLAHWITSTKHSLLQTTNTAINLALTNIDSYKKQRSFSKVRILSKYAIGLLAPAALIRLVEGPFTLTKLFLQSVVPHFMNRYGHGKVRSSLSTLSGFIKKISQKANSYLKSIVQKVSLSFQKTVHARAHFIDPKRRDALQSLSNEEKRYIIECIEQSQTRKSAPQYVQEAFFSMQTEPHKTFFIQSQPFKEQDCYAYNVLLCYDNLSEEEKKALTPSLFLLLPPVFQMRLKEITQEEDDLLITSKFNSLSREEKGKILVPSIQECREMSHELREDFLSLLSTSSQKRHIPGKSAYDRYMHCQALFQEGSLHELQKILSIYPKLQPNDCEALTPSRIRRMSLEKQNQLHALIQKKTPVFDETNYPLLSCLFSELPISIQNSLLDLTQEEFCAFTFLEKMHFLSIFLFHMKSQLSYMHTLKEDVEFESVPESFFQQHIEMIESCIQKLSENHSLDETGDLLQAFNSIPLSLKKKCRKSIEEDQDVCMQNQRALLEEVKMIDSVYRTCQRDILKVKLSAGHYLKQALEAERLIRSLQQTKETPHPVIKELQKNMRAFQEGKEERLKELFVLEHVLEDLSKKRKRKIQIIEDKNRPQDPSETDFSKEELEIVQIFIQETESAFSHAIVKSWKKELTAKETLLQKIEYTKERLKENLQEIECTEREKDKKILLYTKNMPLSESDRALLSFYTDKVVCKVQNEARELFRSIRKEFIRASLLSIKKSALAEKISFPLFQSTFLHNIHDEMTQIEKNIYTTYMSGELPQETTPSSTEKAFHISKWTLIKHLFSFKKRVMSR